MSGFAAKVRQSQGGGIRFVTGKEQGRACWFYLKVHDDALRYYKHAMTNNNNIQLSDYGNIIHSGWGSPPPKKVQKFMKAEYNFDTILQG